MDPQQAWEDILRAARALTAEDGSAPPDLSAVAEDMADKVMALQGWLSIGGFAPDWRAAGKKVFGE